MLTDQINQDLKSAMKEKNEVALSSLRNLLAALKNAQIEKMAELTDADIQKVVAKKVKQHKDSIESFQAGNRPDLAEHERAQMAVLEKYQPKQMDEAELTRIVSETIKELSANAADFGKVMKAVMAKTAGQADGSMVTRIVKEQLK